MVLPLFFLLVMVWGFFGHEISELSELFRWFLFQPPTFDSVPLLPFVFLYSLGFFFSAAYFVSSSSFVPRSAFSFSGCSSHPGSIPDSLLSPLLLSRHRKKAGQLVSVLFTLSVFLLLSPVPVEENKSLPLLIVQ